MFRRPLCLALMVMAAGAVALAAQGKVKQYGRATVEYRSDDVAVVANYDYSQKNHAGPWLLVTFAVQGLKKPIVIMIVPETVGLRLPIFDTMKPEEGANTRITIMKGN